MKEFLSARHVPYIDRDVSTDPVAESELAALGYMTTPVVKIDGEVIVGFNRKRLEELFG
ncbi:MAG: glutaredoxin family protein [Candidatus Rokuibacteriota bacterium]